MKKKINIFLLSFIFFISSFSPCMYSYAQGTEWTSGQKTKFFAEGFYKIVTDICGLILPTGLGGQNLQQDYQNYVLNNDWIQTNMTYDEWIASQISGAYINGSSGNSDVTFSADLQNSLNEWAHQYTDSANFTFVYSGGSQILRESYSNDNRYNNTISFLNLHDQQFLLSNFDNRIYIGDVVPDYFVKTSYTSNGGPNFYCTPFKNGSSVTIHYTVYSLNYGTNEWSQYSSENDRQIFAFNEPLNNYPYASKSWSFITDTNITQYILYDSVQDAQNSNTSNLSYYVTDSFNTYDNSNPITNDYSTTTNSINNSISYGDVQNYANNYYVENNSYPTINNVYNYINTYVPPDNGGDSGDDNGGGNSSNIFDFLGTIGDFLGNLIKGIGNVLSGILSAITDVIDLFIGENGLPNVIGQLINYFLPFLPEWVPTVIGLSVTLALLIGIVKLIRGS